MKPKKTIARESMYRRMVKCLTATEITGYGVIKFLARGTWWSIKFIIALVIAGGVSLVGMVTAFLIFLFIYEAPTREEKILGRRMEEMREYGNEIRLSAATPWPWDKACLIGSTYEFNDYTLAKVAGTGVDTSKAGKNLPFPFDMGPESRGAWIFFYKDQKPWAIRYLTYGLNLETGDCITPSQDYIERN